MGWFLSEEDAQPILQRNGILSAFYADAVLLPQIAWRVAPSGLLIGYPAVMLWASGWSFGYREPFRSLSEVMIWLGLYTVPGLCGAGVRIAGI